MLRKVTCSYGLIGTGFLLGKIQMGAALDSQAVLLLIFLGRKVDIHCSDIDLIDISGIIAQIDDDISIELATSIIITRNYTDESELDFNKRIGEAFEQFYKKTISSDKG